MCVLRLNRKYEKLVESANDSNAEADANDSNSIGPLEATIKNLQKEVSNHLHKYHALSAINYVQIMHL
jgi:phage host-nuclease inhibitor protein Gam